MAEKVVVSWSGGKDSCLACYRAQKDGYEVAGLLNCASEEFRRSSGHGVRVELMARQAKAVGLPLYQNIVKTDDYKAKFVARVKELMRAGVTGVVTGDVYLEDARDWMRNVCREAGAKAIMPLWGRNSREVVLDFIDAGFEAIVVCVKADLLGPEWLGRKIDRAFVSALAEANPRVDLCGENGEFHTFVIGGPLFKDRVRALPGEKVLREGYWLLDLV
ncbi:MAG TPA: diphthine--ammonia ligase [Candidatus Sulfotelmatobacter sp.]|nr:diphthine--ammonia ligase [Candidatus Sulfotelmatobacter sp.]